MNNTSKSIITLFISLALSGCTKDDATDKAASTEKTATPKVNGKATEKAAEPAHSIPTQAKTETERGYPIHTRETAHASTHTVLDYYTKNFKFIPNLAGVMAESPAALNSYYNLQQNLEKLGALSPPENNIVQMTIAMENECQYCVSGHTMAGKVFFKSPDEQMEAIRTKSALPEPKLNALREFTLQVYNSRGRVTDKQLKTFIDAGYTRQQSLDVVTNVSAKVLSNFINQVARIPLDEPFKPFAKGLPFAEDRKTITSK